MFWLFLVSFTDTSVMIPPTTYTAPSWIFLSFSSVPASSSSASSSLSPAKSRDCAVQFFCNRSTYFPRGCPDIYTPRTDFSSESFSVSGYSSTSGYGTLVLAAKSSPMISNSDSCPDSLLFLSLAVSTILSTTAAPTLFIPDRPYRIFPSLMENLATPSFMSGGSISTFICLQTFIYFATLPLLSRTDDISAAINSTG